MMSSRIRRGRRSQAPLRIFQEEHEERQGIGSILGISGHKAEKKGSLRRTFSADMSSKKWLEQNLPLSLKKIASSKEFSTISSQDTSSSWSMSPSASSESEEEKEQRRKDLEVPDQFDIWSSIQSQKANHPNSLLNPPYVHPLIKRSSSSLSEKSLLICTESLGSETGSEGFSSYFSSDVSDCDDDDDDDNENQVLEQQQHKEEEEEEEVIQVQEQTPNIKKEHTTVNYNCSMSRRSTTCSFPPPLPSISRRDGPRLQMRPHRQDGRLVVEAVPVPSLNYFHAQRESGRLRLSFINSSSQTLSPQEASKLVHANKAEQVEIKDETETEQREKEQEEEIDEEDVTKTIIFEVKVEKEERAREIDWAPLTEKRLITGFHVVHLKNINPSSEKKLDDTDDAKRVSPILSCTASFNGYDLYWKSQAKTVTAAKPGKSTLWKKPMVFKPSEFLPMNVIRRCNDNRRPLLALESFCIATT